MFFFTQTQIEEQNLLKEQAATLKENPRHENENEIIPNFSKENKDNNLAKPEKPNMFL
jgi:hypothetical protein